MLTKCLLYCPDNVFMVSLLKLGEECVESVWFNWVDVIAHEIVLVDDFDIVC